MMDDLDFGDGAGTFKSPQSRLSDEENLFGEDHDTMNVLDMDMNKDDIMNDAFDLKEEQPGSGAASAVPTGGTGASSVSENSSSSARVSSASAAPVSNGNATAPATDSVKQEMDVEAGPRESSESVKPKDSPKEPAPNASEPPSGVKAAKQTHTVVIPSYSSWFNMRGISDIERESLPEFFSGFNKSKTPQVYVKYRNFMINAYRLHPTEYLTVTACRRNLVGDACAIMRIHQFLEKWGLVNYQVDAETWPASVSPPFTGHWQVKYDTPRGIYPFQVYKGMEDPANQPRASYSNMPQGQQQGTQTPQGQQPQAQKKEDKKEPEEWKDDWSKEEVLKLLEAVEETPHDWDQIAKKVGRDRMQVVLKFVQQNTEDKFCEEDLGPLKYNTNHIPFSRSENPVLSVLAFFASLSSPQTVKAVIEAIKNAKGEKDTETTKSVSAALGLAAERSKVFSDLTEKQMYQKYMSLVQHKLEILDVKLEKFNLMEQALDTERREIDKERELLFLDRLAQRRSVDKIEELLTQAAEAAESNDSGKSKVLVDEARKVLQTKQSYRFASKEESTADPKPLSTLLGEKFKRWTP